MKLKCQFQLQQGFSYPDEHSVVNLAKSEKLQDLLCLQTLVKQVFELPQKMSGKVS
jgi:hypothetical protein